MLYSCHTCDFIARFGSATLSRDKIASRTWHVAQLINSHATPFPLLLLVFHVAQHSRDDQRQTLFPNRAALYSMQLCREDVSKFKVARGNFWKNESEIWKAIPIWRLKSRS